ncbi:MAG: hypothetical protein OES46_21260, partial [Gammaproteobacteria bacterium]|nr:hypothetical protein [Gammaproteobacteria bacterium]
MAVPVIAASGTAVAGAGNLNVPYPSGISAGHLLLLIASDTGSGSFTNPSGWTVIRNNTTPSPNTAAWFKIAVGTESGTLTLTVGSSNPHIARMHRVTGGDSVNALVNNSGNDKVIPHPSITTTVGDSLVCVVGGVDDDETASSFTGETGGDLTLHSQDSTTTGSDHLLYLQTAGMASTGTISGGTWEFAGAKENYSHIAFAIYGNPVWDQDSYRFRDDDGNETGATWLAAANTTPPDIALDTNFRLRFLIQNTKAFTGGPATHDFRIEYRVNTGGGFGSWTNPDGQGNSIKPVKASLSNEFTDGSNTTQQLGSGTFTGGEMEESSYFMDGITKTVGNDEFELEFCLAFNSSATTPASAGDIFEFRIRYFDGGVQDLGSYTNTPSVTAAAGGATTPKTLSVTATGTPNFSNVTTFAKALSQTATGAVGFLRKISLTKAVAATGAPAFSRVATFLRTFAVGATGSPGFSFANIFQRTFAVA